MHQSFCQDIKGDSESFQPNRQSPEESGIITMYIDEIEPSVLETYIQIIANSDKRHIWLSQENRLIGFEIDRANKTVYLIFEEEYHPYRFSSPFAFDSLDQPNLLEILLDISNTPSATLIYLQSNMYHYLNFKELTQTREILRVFGDLVYNIETIREIIVHPPRFEERQQDVFSYVISFHNLY